MAVIKQEMGWLRGGESMLAQIGRPVIHHVQKPWQSSWQQGHAPEVAPQSSDRPGIGACERKESPPSDRPPSSSKADSLTFYGLPKTSIITWEPSVQTHKPMRVISDWNSKVPYSRAPPPTGTAQPQALSSGTKASKGGSSETTS